MPFLVSFVFNFGKGDLSFLELYLAYLKVLLMLIEVDLECFFF